MALLPHLRQIVDSAPSPGAWNMAVDAVLLRSAMDQGLATLRWYRWSEPTVSLGYFQNSADVEHDVRLAGRPRVRRLSGGGALVHDQELTYSLTLPADQQLVEHPVSLYRLVHQAFVDAFAAWGAQVTFRGTTTRLDQEPVLCFSRQDENDLVVSGFKVLGSAQRRRRGAILQHGGLLLRASAVTPELPGVLDLCPAVPVSGLIATLSELLPSRLATESEFAPLTVMELDAAAKLADPEEQPPRRAAP